jgi:hypothetical protein
MWDLTKPLDGVQCQENACPHRATLIFGEGMDAVRGYGIPMCDCCYFKRCNQAYQRLKEGIDGLKAKADACK